MHPYRDGPTFAEDRSKRSGRVVGDWYTAETECTIKAAIDGDREQLGHLIASHLWLVEAICRDRLDDEEEVESAVGRTIAGATKGITSLAEPRSFRSWLRQIAHRSAIAEYGARQWARSSVIDLDALGDDEPSVEPSENEIATRDEVRRILARIPEPYRQPLIMRDYLGLPCSEVASSLERNESTVRGQIRRGRQAFRLLMEVGTQ